MNKLQNVFRFGWPYLRRYWQRLLIGILVGLFFAIISASSMWATKTLFARVAPPSPDASELAAPPVPALSAAPSPAASVGQPQPALSRVDRSKAWLLAKKDAVHQAANDTIDPWLPSKGRPLDARQILGGLLLLPLLVGLRGLMNYLNTYFLSWVGERAMNDLRLDLLRKLTSLSLDFYNRAKIGDLVTRINGDTIQLQRALGLGFSDLLREPLVILFILGGMLLIEWRLTLFLVLFLPIIAIPLIILGRKTRHAAGESRRATVSQSGLLIEAITGIRIVKAFALEEAQARRFRDNSFALFRHGMKGIQAKAQLNPIIETIAMIGLGGLIVYIISSGTQIDDLAGFLMGVILCYESIKKLANAHMVFQQSSVSVDRLIQLMAEMPTVREPAAPKPIAGFQREIVFDHVSFDYGNQPVIRDLSLSIPKGCKLGIAGESGSGKSTLVNLLFRFYDPTAGRILIDGVDLRDMASADLRRIMAIVTQEIVIFDQTVAENIANGRQGATRAEIEEAARAAHAHEFIAQLPLGYDARVGERGVTLSGGQRQRLSIARAFIRNAPILALDEATASLDSQAEAEVQAAIEHLEQNRTVVCVAHRLSTLASMDRILVLGEGRILEQGTYAELLRANGSFAAMARKQGIL